MLEEVLGLGVDIQLTGLALGEVEGGRPRGRIDPRAPLLFLKLEGDTTDGSTLDALHEMGG